MRSPNSTINRLGAVFAGILTVLALTLSAAARERTLAVLAPDDSASGRRFAEDLGMLLAASNKVLDASLSETAFRAAAPASPFNMTTAEARSAGASIGCDFFVLVRSETLRRSSFGRPEYYESYAAIYVVSSRTGNLVDWSMPKFEAASPAESAYLLLLSIKTTADELTTRIARVAEREAIAEKPAPMEELPPETSPDARSFRAPIPFRRIKPEYTTTAFLFDVAATVEIELDLDAAGRILRTGIVRWAGYGLDESVETAVRSMNWRPAERNGKALPMRVLLRYNFKKIDK
jgi:hypothetical protein